MTDQRAVDALRAAATTIIEKRSNANQGDRARFFDAMPPMDFIEGPDWSLDEHGFAEWVVALLATLAAEEPAERDDAAYPATGLDWNAALDAAMAEVGAFETPSEGWHAGYISKGDVLNTLLGLRRIAAEEPAEGREALWEKFTGGEKLAYGLGYRDAERLAKTPDPATAETYYREAGGTEADRPWREAKTPDPATGLDVNGPDCDCDCHADPDMDPAVCDNCTGKSERERATPATGPRPDIAADLGLRPVFDAALNAKPDR